MKNHKGTKTTKKSSFEKKALEKKPFVFFVPLW